MRSCERALMSSRDCFTSSESDPNSHTHCHADGNDNSYTDGDAYEHADEAYSDTEAAPHACAAPDSVAVM